MSVYGNIIRENDEIMYMYTIFQHESSIDSLLESNISDSIIVEGVSFQQIKEGAKKLFRALIDKASKIIGWITQKFKDIINAIKKKFNEIMNKNKKPLSDQVKEAEKAAKEEPKEEEKPKKEIPFEELQAFMNTKTRINTLNTEAVINAADEFLKKDVFGNIDIGDYDDIGVTFKDYITKHFKDLLVNDGEGFARSVLVNGNIEKRIKIIDKYLILNVNSQKKKLEHNIAVYKQKIAEIDNMANKNVDLSQFKSVEDLVSFEYENSERQRKTYSNRVKRAEKDLSYVVSVFNTLGEYYSALVSEYGKIQNFLN